MTGPQFAAAHGNDSTDWTAADFETELNLAEADALPAYRFLQARLQQTTTPAVTPAA